MGLPHSPLASVAISLCRGRNPFRQLADLARAVTPKSTVALFFEDDPSDTFALGDPFVVRALLSRTGFRPLEIRRIDQTPALQGWVVDALRTA